jgi:hypothetical protein
LNVSHIARTAGSGYSKTLERTAQIQRGTGGYLPHSNCFCGPSLIHLYLWMIANVTISQNPKKKKIQNLGIYLKYNKNLFSLKIHFPKQLLIFFFFRDKKLRMNICFLKI